MRRLAALAFLLVLAACASPVDSEQLRQCRLVLPALHPDGTDIRESRVAPASLGRQGVRIDYTAQEPGAASKAHHTACGFAGTALQGDRLDLVALETERGPLGEARLIYLKRFWLGTSAASEAKGVEPPPNVPEISPGLAFAIQQLVNDRQSLAL